MRHFTYRNLSELQNDATARGARHIEFESDPGKIRQLMCRPVPVGGFLVGNAMAIHPRDGCDATLDGRPDELTWRRYQRFAHGGAKLLWFEATAVREDGRANARQLWINPGNVDDYARILEMIRTVHSGRWGTADDLLAPIQLTHSGRYSYPRKMIAYHNPHIDLKSGTPADYPTLTDDELLRLEDDYLIAKDGAIRLTTLPHDPNAIG